MQEFRPLGKPTFYDIDARRREKFPYEKDGDPELNLRLRRSVSWLRRAEKFYYSGRPDLDLAFTCYWIAFNALYADSSTEAKKGGEQDIFNNYFEKLLDLDTSGKINQALWTNRLNEDEVRDFLQNEFVYKPFWSADNWTKDFDMHNQDALDAITATDTWTALKTLFKRMYLLRNQIIHGSATWNGGRNFDQLRDGSHIMALLVPLFIELTMDNPEFDWGEPHYTLPYGTPGVSPVKDN